MKNGNYNEIEEILQKRFKGVKDDIKDPGFINIEYKEKEKKESFFKKPAVYAAGLVLVAVLVCGGTFIGLKLLERIGAQNIASPNTTSEYESTETTAEQTEENKGYYPVHLRISCGGRDRYLQSYMKWESENDGETERITYASGHHSEYKDLDNVTVFESAVLDFQWYYTPEDGMEATVKCRLAGEEGLFDMDEIQSVLSYYARGKIYRLIAVAEFEILSDGVTRKGCYEYPFDFYYIDDSETYFETAEPKGPIFMTVKSGGDTIYPNAYFLWSEKYSDGDGAWIDADGTGAETVKAVPEIAFDRVSLEIGYENASEVHYSIKQNEKPVYSGDGDLSGFFSEAEHGVYRVIASFTVTGREIDGKFESSAWECPFDVYIPKKETTETNAETETVTETETETDIITETEVATEQEETTETNAETETVTETETGTVTETEAATEQEETTDNDIFELKPENSLIRAGKKDLDPVSRTDLKTNHTEYIDIDVFLVYSEGFYIESKNSAEITLIQSETVKVGGERDKKTYKTLNELNDSINDAADERTESIYVRIEAKTDAYCDVYEIEIMLHHASYPVYPSVSSGGKIIFPEAFYTDDDEAVFAAEAPQISLGDDGLTVAYSENGVVSVSYRIADTERQNLTLKELNGYLKNAPAGRYRVVTDFSVIRGDEGEYKEESVFKYPFDVIVPPSAEPENGKYPVYLAVKSGDETIYPVGYNWWTEQYYNGGWVSSDGVGTNGAENMLMLLRYNDNDLQIAYKEGENGTYISGCSCTDENGKSCLTVIDDPMFSFDDVKEFLKTADKGVYRVSITFIVKGRKIDGEYERSCWEYPFGVAVDDNVQHPEG